MASEIIMSEMYCLEMVVCGHHIQKQVWTPVVGEKVPVDIEDDDTKLTHDSEWQVKVCKCVRILVKLVYSLITGIPCILIDYASYILRSNFCELN